MKILQICPSFPYPPNDGGKIVGLNFYTHFTRFGHKVDIICISKIFVDKLAINEIHTDNQIKVIYDSAIPSIRRLLKCLFLFKPYLMYKFYSKKMMKLIISELEHNQYDAIHCEGLQTAYYALKLTRITHKPVIIRFHNIESQISYRFANVTRNWFTKFFLYYESILTKRLENKVYRHIRNILFITEQDFKSALTIHSKTDHNYFISPAGVDIDFFTPHQALSDDIIFLGSMDWKPNEDAVLWFHQHVISEILNRYKHVKFYIVGKNPSLKIRKLETERVIVTGTVPDVRPFIKRTGIAVVPLRIGGGMRVKILEMMACGMPVISTGLGAEGIDCNDRHNLFIAETKEDFVNRISELIDQPELKEAISKEARITVENNYSWNTKMRELEKYYQKFFQTQ